jgi:hypothetical protein
VACGRRPDQIYRRRHNARGAHELAALLRKPATVVPNRPEPPAQGGDTYATVLPIPSSAFYDAGTTIGYTNTKRYVSLWRHGARRRLQLLVDRSAVRRRRPLGRTSAPWSSSRRSLDPVTCNDDHYLMSRKVYVLNQMFARRRCIPRSSTVTQRPATTSSPSRIPSYACSHVQTVESLKANRCWPTLRRPLQRGSQHRRIILSEPRRRRRRLVPAARAAELQRQQHRDTD